MSIGYRELAVELRGELERGTWEPGATLPKQDELAEQYGVNIKTVRSAVGLLEAEGLVTAVRRRGTVVRQRPPMRRLGVERYSRSRWKFNDVVAFAADREEAGRAWKPTDQTQTVRKLEATPKVAEALGVEVGSPVYERARLVRDQATPTHSLASYYRPEDVEDTPLVDPTPGPAGRGGGFAVLTMQGLEPREISESFHARMPTPDEVDELELPTGEPVMVLDRITRTDAGRIIEYARGVHAASRFSWTYTFDVPD